MIEAAAYIRVSTEDQTEYSPAAQLKALKDYAKKNDMCISPENIFKDEGISGRTAKKRPDFMRMIATARKYKDKQEKPFSVILVHKFDRFSRNREESIVYKSMLRKECNVKVISITEHIEDDKFSVILEAMLEAMAEYYSLNLSDEVKKGMTEKAERGEFLTTAPIGYEWKDKKIVINEAEAEKIKYIFNSFVSGVPKSQIVRDLNAVGFVTHRGKPIEHRTVDYILKNITYAGYIRWCPNGKINYRLLNTENDSDIITVKGQHPAIIDKDLFDQTQEILKLTAQGKNKRAKETHKHWLSGIVKCSACGASLSYNRRLKSMQCVNYSHSLCAVSHSVTAKKIINAIINALDNVLTITDFSSLVIVPNSPENGEDLKMLENSIAHSKTRLKRLKEAYLNGIIEIDEFKEEKQSEERWLAEYEKELQEKLENNDTIDKDVFLKQISDTKSIITSDAYTDKEKALAIKRCFYKIVYSKPKNTLECEFVYNFN